MKNIQTKGFANIILIVAVVILVGALGYVTLVKKSAPVEQQQPIVAGNTQDTTLPTQLSSVVPNGNTQVPSTTTVKSAPAPKVSSTQNPVLVETTDSIRIKNYLLGHLPLLRGYADALLFDRSKSYGMITMNCAEFFTLDGKTIPVYIPEYVALKQFFSENNIQAKCYAVNTGIGTAHKTPVGYADSYAISANGVCVDYTGGYMGNNFPGEAVIGQFDYSGKAITHAICKKTQ